MDQPKVDHVGRAGWIVGILRFLVYRERGVPATCHFEPDVDADLLIERNVQGICESAHAFSPTVTCRSRSLGVELTPVPGESKVAEPVTYGLDRGVAVHGVDCAGTAHPYAPSSSTVPRPGRSESATTARAPVRSANLSANVRAAISGGSAAENFSVSTISTGT